MSSAEFVALSLATLAGGILGSFGLNLLFQKTRLRSIIQRWRWWGLGLFYVSVLATVGSGLAAIVRRMLRTSGETGVLESPTFFFLFGFLAGLPFTLPTVTSIWRESHGGSRGRARQKPATRQQRMKFAKDLEQQMREFADTSRTVHLGLRGEKNDVLTLGDGFSRQQGERLVAALRGDLQEVGIRRVEGEEKGHEWWVRVNNEPKPDVNA